MGRRWGRSTRVRGWWRGIPVWLVIAVLPCAGWFRPGTREGLANGARMMPPLVGFPRVLKPDLYLLGGLAPSAAYVIETSEGLVLVDSGLERNAGLLKSQLELLKLDWKQVRAVLITHAHIDHSGGAEYMRVAAGA